MSADEIRAKMRSIRRDLRANVKDMVANASQMFDWKSYVRSFPWSSVAIAAVLGYLLVPRRMKVVAYDKATLENFLRENHLVAAPPAEKPAPSVWGTLLPVLGGAAVRIGTSYLTRRGVEWLSQLTPGGAASNVQPPAASSRPVPMKMRP
jgi:hypothetical protein